jgi:hypothetical protein
MNPITREMPWLWRQLWNELKEWRFAWKYRRESVSHGPCTRCGGTSTRLIQEPAPGYTLTHRYICKDRRLCIMMCYFSQLLDKR